jgi:patatin-like phospholipase/acyl hydrolase
VRGLIRIRGGIRGIVELEVLRQIEMSLGGVPIQCFVDLIVGTRSEFAICLGLTPRLTSIALAAS